MQGKKYSFWQLLTNDDNIELVEIPIIQRDYVQGQDNEKVNPIRKNILDSIFLSLSGVNPPLDFDFVYGSLENNKFIPLDGQQRLTTLLLLHWYLAVKDGEFEKVNTIFGKFSYETRISSREFCKEISKHKVILPPQDQKLSEVIMDQPWFYSWWKKDPTIHSMLNMLDDIHVRFDNTHGLFAKLVDIDKPVISFQFIEIEKFGLSDKLYIRMNARGKELTEFEHFKARFEQFVEKNHPELKAEFAKKIDGSWTEFFWNYKENDLIDEPFVRFFSFISEMLYHSQNPFDAIDVEKISKLDFDTLEQIYAVEDNLKFLFASLDLLARIKSTGNFFASVFTKNGYEKSKVALFDDNLDLFIKCKTGIGFEQKEKILFYYILKYLISKGDNTIDQELADRIRVIRNLVLRIRQRKNTDFIPELRYNELHDRLVDLNILLDQSKDVYSLISTSIQMESFNEPLKAEIEKAKLIIQQPSFKETIHRLEDHPQFKGAIHNLGIITNMGQLSSYAIAVYEIWKPDFDLEYNNLIARAMLTIDDYTINIGACALGDRDYFGNGNRWYTILTMTGENGKRINEVLPQFLDTYIVLMGNNSSDKLKSIVDTYLSGNPERDWFYYFIKYPEMLNENNLFAWPDDEFTARHLNKTTLLGYHINPYVRTVARLVKDGKICHEGECFGQYDELSPLGLKNRVILHCEKEGWRITLPERFSLDDALIRNFKLQEIKEKTVYRLKENKNMDRIEIAVKFIKDLVKD